MSDNREDDHRRELRARGIFADGAIAAARNLPAEPPEDLGSMERFTWFDGFAHCDPKFCNPYRSHSHRRPGGR